jgi:hypothetical protein
MDKLLTTEEAADKMNLKPSTLKRWRRLGEGPPYHRLGNSDTGRVRYAEDAIQRWVDARATR